MDVEILPKKGRPSKYQTWMGDKIKEVASQGGHVAEMCVAIDVKSYETFYRWVDEHPEFKTAYNEAKLLSQAFYENLLLAGACGKVKGFNFNALAMVLNNKFPDQYKRNVSGSNTEINIGSINSIDRLDSKALDAKIEQLQKKLQLIPEDEEDESEDILQD